MAGEKNEPISPSEWKVLKIVWQRGPSAARDVFEAAQIEHGWSVSTVKTLLRRLVDKRHLKATRVGNSFLYRPTRPAIKTLRQAADTLLGNAVDGTVGPLLLYMAKQGNLSRDEIAELRSMFDELEEQAKEEDS